MNAFQIMVIQRRIVGIESWENAFNREAVAHSLLIEPAIPKGYQEIYDMMLYGGEMIREVRECNGEFTEAGTLEGLVVGGNTSLGRNIFA